MSLVNYVGSKKNTWGNVVIYAIVGLAGLVCLLPFLYVLSVSLTDPKVYIPFELRFIPRKFSLEVYRQVLSTGDFLNALKNTIIVTVGGVLLCTYTTFAYAYGLTKRKLPLRGFFLFMVLFALLFDVGMIPYYMNIRRLGLINTYWALILPALAIPYNVIIVKSFFQGIPYELEEAAMIDGCDVFRTYFQIILPLSKASLATIILFIAVDQWNQYIKPLMYITDQKLRTLQVWIKMLLVDASTEGVGVGDADNTLPSETVRQASVILSILPIMCVYPFVQKYFVKGVMIGSVKG